MDFDRLDRLPPLPAAAAGLTIGLIPAGLLAAGQTGAGLMVGLGLAAGGWWLVGRRPEADPTPARAPRSSSFAQARTVSPAEAPDAHRVDAPPATPPAPEPSSPPTAALREPRPVAAPARAPVAAAATPYRPALVPIRAGEFTMGSPEDEAGRFDGERAHRVILTRALLMAETAVTQAQYAALMGENPSEFKGTDHPVDSVSWLDAVSYCNALSAWERLSPAYTIAGDDVTWEPDAAGYRLPTEAEWEYAARAGTAEARYGPLDDVAWHAGNSGGQTHSVKGKAPNSWGFYDMLGNVYEWTWDWSGSYPRSPQGVPLVDPAGPTRGGGRVIRGGSFYNVARYVRAAVRNWRHPVVRFRLLGFRPVRFAGPPPRAR